MQFVRNSVKENSLSNPDLISKEDYLEFMTQRGKGWVCEINDNIVGIAIADLKDKNIWALFVSPEYEGKRIGKQLQTYMLNWYFSRTKETVWLGTAPNTRAEKFYELTGWKKVGAVNKGETKFEMTYEDWSKIN
ncbi:MAG: GNAT family N-acetyltransferase [Bacteroidia bacterium]